MPSGTILVDVLFILGGFEADLQAAVIFTFEAAVPDVPDVPG